MNRKEQRKAGSITGLFLALLVSFSVYAEEDLIDISQADIFISDQVYTGEAITPDFYVTLDDRDLNEGDEYEILSWSNNVNIGTATVTIKGIGSYTGTASGTFNIIDELIEYDLWVGGERVTNRNAANITGDGISGSVSYKESSNTLYLSNATVSGSYKAKKPGYSYMYDYYTIYSPFGLKIQLSGENHAGWSLICASSLSFEGNGKLAITGSGIKADVLTVAPESEISVSSTGNTYTCAGVEIGSSADIRGKMKIDVPSGAPAYGLTRYTSSGGSIDVNVSGTLEISLASKYTNLSMGIEAGSGNVAISGNVTVNTSGTKKDIGIRCNKLTVSNTGNLTVDAYTEAVYAKSYAIGNNLVLLAGNDKSSAVYTAFSADAMANEYISLSASNPRQTAPSASGKTTPASSDTGSDAASGKEGTAAPAKKETAAPVKDGTILKNGSASYTVLKNTNTVAYKAPAVKTVKTVTIPASVKINGKSYKVTAIAPNAFKGMKNLTSVIIGKNVKKIGKNAFNSCGKLKKITIRTTKLTKKSVGANAFKGINRKAVIKCPKSKKAAYRKLLLKKGMKKTMTFK